MSNIPRSAPTQRQLRVGEQLKQIVSDTFRRGHFQSEILFDMSQDITVSEVRVSPDMKHATAYIMSLGGKKIEELLEALNEERNTVQKEIARQMKMKFTPRIQFKTDTSFAEAEKIETILHKISKNSSQN